MYYCEETARAAAEALGILADSVALGSTGEIGRQLPIDRMKAGVKHLRRKRMIPSRMEHWRQKPS